MAFVLGLGLMLSVVTMSSFKGNFASSWGQDPTLGWVDINNLPSTGDPDTHYEYDCTGPINVCTRNYSTGDPINGGTYTNGQTGNFSLRIEDNP